MRRMSAEQIQARVDELLSLVELEGMQERMPSDLSTGMKRAVAIARALVHDPILLFLDEPTANLDPEAAKMVRDTILALRKEKRTIFLNTHNLDEAQRVCDRIGILKTSLVAVGSPEELRASLWGRKTVVHLAGVSDSMAAAVRALGYGEVEVVWGSKLVIDVGDPDSENPAIVSAIVKAGGQVRLIHFRLPSP
jgi:ABC-2 type transport system ATP-binding protein